MPTLLTREQYLRAMECAELNGISDRSTLLKMLEDPEQLDTLTYWSEQFYKAPQDIVCVADLQSKEELHYVARYLNWGDGLQAPQAILDHPLCDAGTALLLYWHGQGWLYSNPETADPAKAGVFNRLIERFISKDFASYAISFDPFKEQFVPELSYLLKHGLHFPGYLLATYPGQELTLEHAVYDQYFKAWEAENEGV